MMVTGIAGGLSYALVGCTSAPNFTQPEARKTAPVLHDSVHLTV